MLCDWWDRRGNRKIPQWSTAMLYDRSGSGQLARHEIFGRTVNVWEDGKTYFNLQMNVLGAKAISMFDPDKNPLLIKRCLYFTLRKTRWRWLDFCVWLRENPVGGEAISVFDYDKNPLALTQFLCLNKRKPHWWWSDISVWLWEKPAGGEAMSVFD